MRGLMIGALSALAVAIVLAAKCAYITYTLCGARKWSRCSTVKYRNCDHGEWSEWSRASRGPCSVSCDTGTHTVTYARSCTNPAPSNGGNPCSGQTKQTAVETCDSGYCPINGGWSEFRETSRTPCSQPCGTGNGSLTITKTRSCSNPVPMYNGADCEGSQTTMNVTESCNILLCPIDGGWGAWSNWRTRSKCDVFCGGGELHQTRFRRCNNPAPRYKGKDCGWDTLQDRLFACGEQDCGDLCRKGVNSYLRADNDAQFYQCQHSQNNGVGARAILLKCPYKMVWDHTVKSCVLKVLLFKTPVCVEDNPRVDPSDCSYYFQCYQGSEKRIRCQGETKFDRKLNACAIAKLARC